MSETPIYSDYHPRWYRTRVSTYWWLRRWSYLVFILRELSSVFIAWFIVFTLVGVQAVRQGPEGYSEFLSWARHPVVVVVNVISFFFVVFHAITWFNLAPKAMVVKLGGRRIPAMQIVIGNLAVWAVFSAILAWFILGGP